MLGELINNINVALAVYFKSYYTMTISINVTLSEPNTKLYPGGTVSGIVTLNSDESIDCSIRIEAFGQCRTYWTESKPCGSDFVYLDHVEYLAGGGGRKTASFPPGRHQFAFRQDNTKRGSKIHL